MADEKAAGNHPANSSDSNANKGAGRSNRRRPLRSKRRGRKPEEGSDKPEQRSEGPGRKETRTETRTEGRSDARTSRTARGPQPSSGAADKSLRDNRERRRRRRMRAKQRGPNETVAPVVEDTLKDLPPLVPAFVYTHVLRPASRDSFEFRTEHFSKVTRRMADFHIDLSPLYPEGGDEIKGVAWMPPASERPIVHDDREFDDGGYDDEDDEEYGEAYADAGSYTGLKEDVPPVVKGIAADDADAELYDDPDWDADESEDAARLDGAIADDFYDEMDDSVIDEYPDEDLDA